MANFDKLTCGDVLVTGKYGQAEVVLDCDERRTVWKVCVEGMKSVPFAEKDDALDYAEKLVDEQR